MSNLQTSNGHMSSKTSFNGCQRRLRLHTSPDRNCTLREEVGLRGRLALLPARMPGWFRVGLGPAEGQIAVLPHAVAVAEDVDNARSIFREWKATGETLASCFSEC